MELFTAAVVIVLVLLILVLFFVWIGDGMEGMDNCPGEIKVIKVTPESLQEGTRSYKWTRENNMNYIGLDKCRHGISNYGKKASCFECENTCKSDPYCDFWSYGTSDGDCRGHIAAATNDIPYTTPWDGYISGSKFLGS